MQAGCLRNWNARDPSETGFGMFFSQSTKSFWVRKKSLVCYVSPEKRFHGTLLKKTFDLARLRKVFA